MLVAKETPSTHNKTRILSVIAATTIALACGTNYAYSAWAPQFAEKLQLSATQSNVVGTAANLGMYASGIPMGIITDRKSPRLAAVIGMLALFAGYYPIKLAYDGGPGYMSMSLISFCSFLSGVGSCAAFQAALKTATLNWPTHRGSATACPLAAFGLSAFFYTLIAGIAFPGNTSGLLMMLSLATTLLVLVSIPFLIVVDHKTGTGYAVLPTSDRPRRDSNVIVKTTLDVNRYNATAVQEAVEDPDHLSRASTETSTLLSGPSDVINDLSTDGATNNNSTHSRVDITGLALLYQPEFWQLWVLMGLLTGVGLMTINNIGHDVQALWTFFDSTTPKETVALQQLHHVSIISLFSFLGRLSSGIGSDMLVQRLHLSRFLCAALSALIFALAQIAAIRVTTPTHLWLVSGLSGLAYGVLFGVFPALVVDAFGPAGFAVNWGFMTLAPVVSGNVFNLFYGVVFDSNSVVEADGQRGCEVGVKCYRTAYWVTLGSSLAGVFACIWGMYEEGKRKRRISDEVHGHGDA